MLIKCSAYELDQKGNLTCCHRWQLTTSRTKMRLTDLIAKFYDRYKVTDRARTHSKIGSKCVYYNGYTLLVLSLNHSNKLKLSNYSHIQH